MPDTALLGSTDDYRDCVRLSRLAWCGLALGTAQAVLDYVIPYVNGRVAFGEPISHRQAVAFKVADIGIELDGMRLATYRAASLAEQGKPFDRQVALGDRDGAALLAVDDRDRAAPVALPGDQPVA